ncbi:hypothetical protein NBH00_05155 [Paraconexibacter antarcticus]|uniref:Uncharacterized protein n=1 Tax=Paraconexibacter antarcticus TaxID=2949664 RepID=A0ABY5DUA0_9ACTN|nr:hypothetical protein [Paraconexibacter antarcticus]UTI65598.1 hypothetical protein NBH00_05155 [Paraconexibacter antarcticus]
MPVQNTNKGGTVRATHEGNRQRAQRVRVDRAKLVKVLTTPAPKKAEGWGGFIPGMPKPKPAPAPPKRPLALLDKLDTKTGKAHPVSDQGQVKKTAQRAAVTLLKTGGGPHSLKDKENAAETLKNVGLIPGATVLKDHQRRAAQREQADQDMQAAAAERKSARKGSLLGVIDAIPVVGGTINAAAGLGGKGLHLTTGELGNILAETGSGYGLIPGAGKVIKNAITDAGDIPTQLLPSLYETGKAGVKALEGDSSDLKAQGRALRDQTFLGKLLAHGDVKGALKQAENHPLNSALELSGARAITGRGALTAARLATKVGPLAEGKIADFANAERVPLKLSGDRVVHRDIPGRPGAYSESADVRAGQMAYDRHRSKKSAKHAANAERLTAEAEAATGARHIELRAQAQEEAHLAARHDPNQASPSRVKRELKRRAGIESSMHQAAQRTERSADMHFIEQTKPDRRPVADRVGEASQPKYPHVFIDIGQEGGSPQSLVADLTRIRDRLIAEREAHGHTYTQTQAENVAEHIDELDRALADKNFIHEQSQPNSSYYRAIQAYAERQGEKEPRLVENANLTEHQIAAKYIPAMVGHDLGDHVPRGARLPTEKKKAYEVARLTARADAKARKTTSNVLLSELGKRKDAAVVHARAEGAAAVRAQRTESDAARAAAAEADRHAARVEKLQKGFGSLSQRLGDRKDRVASLEQELKAAQNGTSGPLLDRIAGAKASVAKTEATLERTGQKIDELQATGPRIPMQSAVESARSKALLRADISRGIKRNVVQLSDTVKRLASEDRDATRGEARAVRDLKPRKGEAYNTFRFMAKQPDGTLSRTEPVTIADMEDFFASRPSRLDENLPGPLKPIFISHRTSKGGTFSSSGFPQPPRSRTKRTGQAAKQGTAEGAWRNVQASLVSQGVRANAAEAFQRVLGRYKIDRLLDDAGDAERAREHAERTLGVPMKVLNLKPLLEISKITDKIAERIGDHEVKAALGEDGGNFLEGLVRTAVASAHNLEGPGQYAVMPADLVDHFAELASSMSALKINGATIPAVQFMQKFTQNFRMTVLPFSTRWFFGNHAEPLLFRMPLHGIGPSDMRLGAAIARAEEHAGHTDLVNALGGMHFGSAALQQIHDLNPGAISKTLRLRGMRHVRAGFLRSRAKILEANSAGEHRYQQAVLGAYTKKWAKTAEGKAALKAVREARPELRKTFALLAKSQQHNADLVEAFIEKGIADPDRVAHMLGYQWQVLGRYTGHTANERWVINNFAPFLDWYRNSLFMLGWTLPVRHPVKMGMFAAMEEALQDKIRAEGQYHGSPLSTPNRGYLLGGIPEKNGSILPLQKYLPVGAFSDPLQSASSLITPQFKAVEDTFAGKAFTGNDLKLSGGNTPTQLDQILIALYNLGKSQVPLAAQLQTIREGGGSGFDDSTLFAPKTRPGTSGGVVKGLNKTFNPLKPYTPGNRSGTGGGSGDAFDKYLTKTSGAADAYGKYVKNGGGSGAADAFDKYLKKQGG